MTIAAAAARRAGAVLPLRLLSAPRRSSQSDQADHGEHGNEPADHTGRQRWNGIEAIQSVNACRVGAVGQAIVVVIFVVVTDELGVWRAVRADGIKENVCGLTGIDQDRDADDSAHIDGCKARKRKQQRIALRRTRAHLRAGHLL